MTIVYLSKMLGPPCISWTRRTRNEIEKVAKIPTRTMNPLNHEGRWCLSITAVRSNLRPDTTDIWKLEQPVNMTILTNLYKHVTLRMRLNSQITPTATIVMPCSLLSTAQRQHKTTINIQATEGVRQNWMRKMTLRGIIKCGIEGRSRIYPLKNEVN